MRCAPFPVLPFLLLLTTSAFAQQSVISSPQAAALAASALNALTGGTQVSDVTLNGTGTRTAGSDVESGNFTLKALGPNQSRSDLVVSGGTRSEVFNLSNGTPQGFWSGIDGTNHPIPNHNCIAGLVWFFPALSVLSQASNPNYAISYVGPESRNGTAVQHIRFTAQSSALPAASSQMIAQLSSSDVYLDSSSDLLVALVFNTHPDNDLLTDIPVEVDFSNYQNVRGVAIPFRVQKYVHGSLYLNLTVESAIVNSGLTDSAFSSN
jgi:hypothetical protein